MILLYNVEVLTYSIHMTFSTSVFTGYVYIYSLIYILLNSPYVIQPSCGFCLSLIYMYMYMYEGCVVMFFTVFMNFLSKRWTVATNDLWVPQQSKPLYGKTLHLLYLTLNVTKYAIQTSHNVSINPYHINSKILTSSPNKF